MTPPTTGKAEPMTASNPKTPTASGISRLRAKAGFEKSESSASRIKGWRNYSEGYSVTKWDDYGTIEVTWHKGLRWPAEADEIRPVMFARYAEAITKVGYSAELKNGRLIVTSGKADQ